jgi:hypothetical protein
LQSHAHQNDRWTSLLAGLINELKELGDVSNWALMLEEIAGEIRNIATNVEASTR